MLTYPLVDKCYPFFNTVLNVVNVRGGEEFLERCMAYYNYLHAGMILSTHMVYATAYCAHLSIA